MSHLVVQSGLHKLTQSASPSCLRHALSAFRKLQLPPSCGCDLWSERQQHSTPTRPKSAPPRNVVSVSSIHQQDGLEIQELPILVRLLDKNTIPLSSHAYCGENIRSMSIEDENFQALLQQCATVKDVFKLLEIPSDQVTGYSASAALRRMCELQKMSSDWDNLHSFIRTAVMNELTDTVRRDVSSLSNDVLVSLVSCALNMDSFGAACQSAVHGEIEKRMVEEQFPLKELCALSDLLHQNPRADKDLMDAIWVHIGNHFQDVREDNISALLASLPPARKYLLKVLAKQVHKFWWKMTPDQTAASLSSLVKLNSLQGGMMTDFAHWLFLNINRIDQRGLMQFLAAFIHFRFSDAKFTTALQRYVAARWPQLDNNLLALATEYCLTRRYFSPVILDAAARHFEQFADTYSALQMFTVLRVFGHLNYMPKDNQGFLLQTEKMLEERFLEFQPEHMAELLCSFAFVQRIPINFVEKVLTPSYLSKVRGLAERNMTSVWLEMLQSAVKLETRGVHVPYLYKMPQGTVWRNDKCFKIQIRLTETLGTMLGSGCAKANTFASNTIYMIDTELHLDKEGKPIEYQTPPSPEAATRLAFIISTPEHYCINSGHLLGEFSMRNRHLIRMGFTLIEVPDTQFLAFTVPEREKFLKNRLKRWVPPAVLENSSRDD